MKYKKLTDAELWTLTKKKAQEERNITLEVINLIREVFVRHLHLERGYFSLHEYCVKELKYSDGAASRRIKAMHLVEEIPEAVGALSSGKLNLTTASQLQSAFEVKAKKCEVVEKSEKVRLFNQIQNIPKREVETILAKLNPEIAVIKEKVKPINETEVRLELVINKELFEKIEQLKNLTSHKNQNIRDLFESLVLEELKRRDPQLKKSRLKNVEKLVPTTRLQKNIKTVLKTNSATLEAVFESPIEKANFEIAQPANRAAVQPAFTEKLTSTNSVNLQKTTHQDTPKLSGAAPLQRDLALVNKKVPYRTRYIPSAIRHYVWMRDRGQCTFVDPVTKNKCNSKHKLQYEHVQPYSWGGDNTAENLRLLCRQHNNFMAIRLLGEKKMSFYKSFTRK